jgi:DNA-binding MurR/RpiR family transcriptional regulator
MKVKILNNIEKFKKQSEEFTNTKLALLYGVSRATIIKWQKQLGLTKKKAGRPVFNQFEV